MALPPAPSCSAGNAVYASYDGAAITETSPRRGLAEAQAGSNDGRKNRGQTEKEAGRAASALSDTSGNCRNDRGPYPAQACAFEVGLDAETRCRARAGLAPCLRHPKHRPAGTHTAHGKHPCRGRVCGWPSLSRSGGRSLGGVAGGKAYRFLFPGCQKRVQPPYGRTNRVSFRSACLAAIFCRA